MNTTTAQTITGRQIDMEMTVRHNRTGLAVQVIGEMEWTGLGARYIDTGKRAFMTLGPRDGVHAMIVGLDETVEVAR